MTLDAAEFIRRFLLHVLPDGFQRIRHYGFLANGQRRAKLALIRRLIDTAPATIDAATEEPAPSEPDLFKAPCPCCGGVMVIVEILPGPRRRPFIRPARPRIDSS